MPENKRGALERYVFDPENQDQNANHAPIDPNDDLARAAELLYLILNHSFETSGTPLRCEQHGQQEDIQGLYWRCKEKLDQVSQDPDKTGFLAMSILEHTWELARDLVLCPVSDMLDGDMSMLENARALENILKNNIYKQMWEQRSVQYVTILNRIGFNAEPKAFQDLTGIMDPLLDALMFYTPKKVTAPTNIYKIRDGEISRSGAPPAIAKAICMYQSEKDLVDAVMGSNQDRLMAFGAIEKTHAQVQDYFAEWFNGYPDERQRNMMRNQDLTPEEYMAMPCDYTRAVYLCVKSGGACWLIHMPWRGDYANHIGTQKAEYYYGKRASYAPYQIFYKSVPPAPAGSTMLAIPKTGYLLSELMDNMSMAWYPAFLDETMKLFFNKDDRMPQAQDLILAEETAAIIEPDHERAQEYAVVPVYSGVPALCAWQYIIREPADIFQDDPETVFLFRYFHISPNDIRNIPILPEKQGTPKIMLETTDAKLRKAYLKLLALKIAELQNTRWDARKYMLDKTRDNMPDIVRMAGNGDLMPFMTVTIDGTPVLNPDGTPKTRQRPKYPWDQIPVVTKTSINDGRGPYKNPYTNFSTIVHWASDETSGRPPVVWAIRPVNACDYAALAGCDESELPELLRLSGKLDRFCRRYQNILPRDMSDQYAAVTGKENVTSIYTPCFLKLNICMNKKTYKTFDYFK